MSRAPALFAGLIVIAACAFAPSIGNAQTPITFQYFYDETGQLIRAVDSTGIVIEYVYDAVGNALEVRRLNLNPTQLTILGLSPSKGGRGTLVTIQGIGFSSHAADNIVFFNGVQAPVSSATPNTLVAQVPVGASTGPVSVTVGSSSAISPNPFTVLTIPFIASITPRAFEATKPPISIQVTGSNLTGSQFALMPDFAPPPVVLGSPQIDPTGTVATLPLTVASTARGSFVLVATNTSGSSDAFPNTGNTLTVVNARDDVDGDGDGFPDGLELLFGSDPSDPASTPDFQSQGELVSTTVSVVNTAGVPSTEQTLLSASFSVVNGLLTSDTPQTLVSAAFSVANTLMTSMTSQELLGAVFSVLNSQLLAPTTAQALAANTQQPSVRLDQPHDGDGFVDGQTITVRALVAGTQGVPRVEFAVNGQSFGIDSTFPYELTFTIPSGVRGLTFDATVRDVVGTELTAVPVDVVVEPDPLTTITGRVVDESGNPVEGAVVDLLSEGLQAEFFDFARALATLPDLSGQTPDRITRVTALNLRDPNGIFGFDLFGTRLAPDYSARFSGWIAVATTGTHRFFLGTHEGARLKIGGITVVDISAGSGQYQEGSGSVDLAAGLTPIEVTYYEGVGNAQLQLSFVPPGGERQIVPPSSLVPGIEPYVATTDALGTFILRGVPTALASIRVRATITANNQDVSATSSAVTPVPPTGVNVEDIVIAKQQR